MPSKLVRLAALGLLLGVGCFDEPTFGASSNSSGEVFLEGFGSGVNFQAFSGTDFNALSIDKTIAHAGQKSLKITVPDASAGTYAGGAFTAGDTRDLSKFDALTFWAKASRAIDLDVAGLGNDNTGTSRFAAQRAALAVSTEWTRFVLPIPDPARLTAEKGLFFFAAAAKGSPATGYTLWLDDIQFQTLGAAGLGSVRATFDGGSLTLAPGASDKIKGARLVLPGDATLTFDSRYLGFTSSAPGIATVSADGTVTGVAAGIATIKPTLAGKSVEGELTVNVALPDPTVIALLSAKYPQHAVDTWIATWSMPNGTVKVTDGVDGGDPIKTYTSLQFAGIEFFATAKPIDATEAAFLHLDLKTTDPAEIHVKLVDFGTNGASDPPYDGLPHGDDSQGDLTLGPTSSPPLVADAWVTYDIPLSTFQSATPPLTNRAHLSQLVLAGPSSGTPLVKSLAIRNVYFHR